MKISVKRSFGFMVGTAEVKYAPGVYLVPHDMNTAAAEFGMSFGYAVKVLEKIAPENKLAEVPENKAGLGGPAVHRRGKRTKPDGDSEA
jgi:hypothetical protein